MRKSFVFAAALVLAAGATTVFAGAIRGGQFNSNTLPGNDDGSTGLVGLGFTVNFFGVNRSDGFVNNNGNFTFDNPLSTFTPFNLSTTNRQILAPFFADVDTRSAASMDVTYGTGMVDGRNAFGVNWIDVGFFSNRDVVHNDFQLVIIDRSDTGVGNFDFEFNYDRILWETGQASGGDANGRGGNSARAGWSNGATHSFELTGSAVNGAFLDGGPNALISNSLNSNVLGRYLFNVRNGVVLPAVPLPPAAWAGMGGLGIVGVGAFIRRRRLNARTV